MTPRRRSETMRTLTKLACALAFTGLVALSLQGCGQMPTAPNTTSPAPSASVSGSAQSSGLLSTIGSVVDLAVKLIVRTLNLVGSLGGSLTNGRWQAVVP